MSLDAFVDRALSELEGADLKRRLRVIARVRGPYATIEGRELLCFCSNDYLGLAQAPSPADVFGTGGSRLLTGTHRAHVELEERFARFKGAEAALLFNSAYMANIGLIATIGSPQTVILSDELNHASLIDATRLAKAKTVVFPHRDADAVRRSLREHRSWPLKIVLTESFFSMDGDVAPLKELADLAREEGADLVVDETHATGVFGTHGRGLLEVAGVRCPQVSNLAKAGGVLGGFVVGSAKLRELLITRARTFVYTTSLPSAVCQAGLRAVERLESADAAREKLWRNIRWVAERLRVPPTGPVFPIRLGSPAEALRAGEELWRRGFFLPAIRPPSVPPGTERLRISLSALHEPEHLEALLDALQRL